MSLDVVSDGVKSSLKLWRRPAELARIPEKEFLPNADDGSREELLPLQDRVTLALGLRGAAGCLEAG